MSKYRQWFYRFFKKARVWGTGRISSPNAAHAWASRGKKLRFNIFIKHTKNVTLLCDIPIADHLTSEKVLSHTRGICSCGYSVTNPEANPVLCATKCGIYYYHHHYHHVLLRHHGSNTETRVLWSTDEVIGVSVLLLHKYNWSQQLVFCCTAHFYASTSTTTFAVPPYQHKTAFPTGSPHYRDY